MLKPQTNINKIKLNFWKEIHNHVQYLLNIHLEQGNKSEIFPFDLSNMIVNKWFSTENESYIPSYNDNDSFDEFRIFNIQKIKNERIKIHNRLQYLLNIHSNKENPFPVDLAYMLNLDTHYLIESYKYDKCYEYERSMNSHFYSGPTGYFQFLFNDKNDHNFTYSFYDCENEDSEIKFKCIKKINEVNYIAAPSRYLLWKSCLYDYKYDYKRSLSENRYSSDTYLPYESESEEDIEYSQYDSINDDTEPDFNKFKSLLI